MFFTKTIQLQRDLIVAQRRETKALEKVVEADNNLINILKLQISTARSEIKRLKEERQNELER